MNTTTFEHRGKRVLVRNEDGRGFKLYIDGKYYNRYNTEPEANRAAIHKIDNGL